MLFVRYFCFRALACLGLVLFGFFPLLSLFCMRRFLGSEVCASIFSFLTTHTVTDVSVKQLFVLQTTPSHRGCSGWPGPGTAPAELHVLAHMPGHSFGTELSLQASVGRWKQRWAERGEGGDISSQAPWIAFILIAAGKRPK